MKKIKQGFRQILCVLVVLAVVFGLDKLNEGEKPNVKQEEVRAILLDIGELSTYAGEYNVNIVSENYRDLLGARIPGTTNTIDITCSGIVKVGYNIEEIVVEVDNGSQKIYISLPEPKVNDNYVIWDTVECREENNVLNHIVFSQYQKLISKIEEDGMKQVEQDGIYAAAEANLEKIIRHFLSGFEEYEITFSRQANN